METHLQPEAMERRLVQGEGGVIMVGESVVEEEVRGAAAGRTADQEEGCRISQDYKTQQDVQTHLRRALCDRTESCQTRRKAKIRSLKQQAIQQKRRTLMSKCVSSALAQ